jgi:hypothetical protein
MGHNAAEEGVYPRDWSAYRKPRLRIDVAGYTLITPEPHSLPEAIRYVHADLEKRVILLERRKPYSDADRVKFQSLVEEWKRQIRAESFVMKVAMHPAYQQMIGMGKSILPLIFDRLKQPDEKASYWFWALAAIAAENPIPKDMRGKVQEMKLTWLKWGQDHGHVSLD